MNATTYKYKLVMEYVSGNTSTRIDETQIINIVADYNYEELNMPLLYMTVTLDKKFLDNMIKNSKTDLINLTIYKYVDGSSNTAGTVYFRDQFVYFLKEQLNESDYLDYKGNNASRNDIFKTTVLGLMSLKNINDNNKVINTVINNTTMVNLVQLATSHIKNMLIEPLDYNQPIKTLLLPPKSTVSSTLKFLNNISVFYKTEYRFFMDFNGGYLLSKNGKQVQAKNENIISIIFDVGTIENDASHFGTGMVVDKQKKAYIIPLLHGIECTTDNDEYVTEKLYTNVKSVSTSGTNTEKALNINNSGYNKDKNMFVRLGNDNTNKLSNITSTIESNRIVVNVNKAGLDASIFTPNKIYTINNYAPLKQAGASGKFILVRKREQYNNEANTFTQNIYLTFKKVGDI